MPIEGFPDKNIHRFCVKCHQWFWPEEGVSYVLPRVRLPGMQIAREVSGIYSPARFMCHRCFRIRRWTTFTLFGILILIVAVVLVLAKLGILKR